MSNLITFPTSKDVFSYDDSNSISGRVLLSYSSTDVRAEHGEVRRDDICTHIDDHFGGKRPLSIHTVVPIRLFLSCLKASRAEYASSGHFLVAFCKVEPDG